MFICSSCGYGSASWMGRCPNCSEWNTFVEQKNTDTKEQEGVKKVTLAPLSTISKQKTNRVQTSFNEFNRVLGGGLVAGEVVLLTGEPGIGKSTLLLQSLAKLSAVYISGEESAQQVALRATRLGLSLNKIFFTDSVQVEGIIESLSALDKLPECVVVDSIQTIYSKNQPAVAGSISQLKESITQLITFAKSFKIPIIVVGHVTKEGDIAGPKSLEHYVDCVVMFEGEKVSHFRVLRAHKNRFGSIDEIGIFEMTENGLSEVTNPLVFLDQSGEMEAGRAIVGVVEGKRSLFFEIQTLVTPSILAIPRRVVKGVNYNKVQLLLAVMQKHLNISLNKYDIYINVVGGVSVFSPAADLGIVASVLSSIKNLLLDKKSLFTGEVGLLGEVRAGYLENKLIGEAKRLKFTHIYSSKNAATIKKLATFIAR